MITRALDNYTLSVTLSDPGAAISGTKQLTATATGAADGLQSVAIQQRAVGAPTWTDVCTSATSPKQCPLVTTSYPDGPRELRAIAVDNSGVTAQSAIRSPNIDNSAPAATPSVPLTGSGTVTLGADVQDTGSGIAWVAWEANYQGQWYEFCKDFSAPYECSGNSAQVADGTYQIRIRVLNNAGVETVSSGSPITIDNTAPSGSDIQAGNAGGGTGGQFENGDWVRLTWTEPIKPASVLAGWDGTSTAVRVKVTDVPGGDQMDFYEPTGHHADQSGRDRGRSQARRRLRLGERRLRRDHGPQRELDHGHARQPGRHGRAAHRPGRDDDLEVVDERHRRLQPSEQRQPRDRVRRGGRGLLMRTFATIVATLAMSLAAIGLAVAAPGDPASASLRRASGAVGISNSRAGDHILAAGNMRPGEGVSGTVTIGNDGDVAGRFKVAATPPQDTPGAFGGLLSERVELTLSDVTGATPVVIFTGHPADFAEYDVGTFGPGEEREFRFTMTLPQAAGNAYQGSALSLGFVWTAGTVTPTPTATPTAEAEAEGDAHTGSHADADAGHAQHRGRARPAQRQALRQARQAQAQAARAGRDEDRLRVGRGEPQDQAPEGLQGPQAGQPSRPAQEDEDHAHRAPVQRQDVQGEPHLPRLPLSRPGRAVPFAKRLG